MIKRDYVFSEGSDSNQKSKARARIREFKSLRRIGHTDHGIHGHTVNSVVEVTVEQPLRVHRPALVGELRAV